MHDLAETPAALPAASQSHDGAGREKLKRQDEPQPGATPENEEQLAIIAPLSMRKARKRVRAHLSDAKEDWPGISLSDLLEIEDDVAAVLQHNILQEITGDPDRLQNRTSNPDHKRIYFLGDVEQLIDIYGKLPDRSANLPAFSAFLECYAIRFQPAQYNSLFKGLGITSINTACQMLLYGLKSSMYHRDGTGLLLAHDPYFTWDAYSPAFLSRTMSRQAFYAAISWERFAQPDFLAGLKFRDLAYFMRESLKPDTLEDTQDSRVALLRHFATHVPKVLALLDAFGDERKRKLWRRICDRAFTQFHYRVVSESGVEPWEFHWPECRHIAQMDVARWRYQDEMQGKDWVIRIPTRMQRRSIGQQ